MIGLKILSLILFSFYISDAKRADISIWTQESFKKNCRTENGKVSEKIDTDRIHLECRVYGKEISSVWFDKKSKKMSGWLERSRNLDRVLVKDQEFHQDGSLKQEGFYIRTDDSSVENIQNLFVFDGNKKLIRGNITVGGDTYVVATPDLIFHNGNRISLEDLSKRVSKTFKVNEEKHFYSLIDKIWNTQNTTKSQNNNSTSPTSSK